MNRILPFAGLLLLTGCIVVKHFGAYWQKGYDDPCIQQIVEATILDGNPQGTPVKLLAKSLRVGQHRFLLLRDKPNDEGGNIYRYSVENGEYIAYRLNERMREPFLRDYPKNNAVTLTSETATIDTLEPNSVALLEAVAGTPEYWIEVERRPYNPGHRQDCVEKSK